MADRPEMSDVQHATPMAHFETVRVARGLNAAACVGTRGVLHKQATIHFVPKSDGNLAESIQINAS